MNDSIKARLEALGLSTGRPVGDGLFRATSHDDGLVDTAMRGADAAPGRHRAGIGTRDAFGVPASHRKAPMHVVLQGDGGRLRFEPGRDRRHSCATKEHSVTRRTTCAARES